MLELFQMWALVEAIGLIFLPLTVVVCHNLPDRGWAFSKSLGLIVFAFCIWLPLMALPVLPYSQFFLLGVLLILLGCNGLALRSTYRTIRATCSRHKAYILATEYVFLMMVLLLGWLRSYRPDIRSFEMFMDEGFIAAIMRSPHLPPNDMWFAGHSINYYYYAHFLIATLAKLLGQAPSIAFNTGICIFFGLTAVNLFGVTCNTLAWARHNNRQQALSSQELQSSWQQEPSLVGALPYGAITVVMGIVMGNLAATQQWWEQHGSVVPYNWFGPSRVIENTINEFPAFSFLLSCFHAHVLAFAFTILAIGLALNLLLEPKEVGLSVFGRGWQLPLTLGVTALVLGALFLMNGWDYPMYIGLTILCIGLQHWFVLRGRAQSSEQGSGIASPLLIKGCIAAAGLIVLSLVCYLPFWLAFSSPAQGIGLVAAKDRSPLQGEVLIYGLFGYIYLALLLGGLWFARETFRKSSSVFSTNKVVVGGIGLILLDLLIFLFLPNSPTLVVMLTLALLGAGAALIFLPHNRALAFPFLLGSIAFALVAICEVVYLRDVFGDGPSARMNTIFKFYFQSWGLLSIASGCALSFLMQDLQVFQRLALPRRWLTRGVTLFWIVGLVGLSLASLVYPILAPPARLAHYDSHVQRLVLSGSASLDGLPYLQRCRPPDMDPDPFPFCTFDVSADYPAIRWLNEHVQGSPVIVEAFGNDYTLYGRVSIFTGLPTLIGWSGHEYQWRVNWLRNQSNRDEYQRRAPDIDTIYTNPDPQVVLATMDRYQAQYLYVGPLEQIKYKDKADLTRFGSFLTTVYKSAGVTIYKVP